MPLFPVYSLSLDNNHPSTIIFKSLSIHLSSLLFLL